MTNESRLLNVSSFPSVGVWNWGQNRVRERAVYERAVNKEAVDKEPREAAKRQLELDFFFPFLF